jgi:hypothetical protein
MIDYQLCARRIKHYLFVKHNIPKLGLKNKRAVEIFCELYNLDIIKEGVSRDGIRKKLADFYINGNFKGVSLMVNGAVNFYETEEWRSLRVKVIKRYGKNCMKCGRGDRQTHIDHIKPRSLFPELELDFNNLQVLCKVCNMKKSNKNTIDYRPKHFSVL